MTTRVLLAALAATASLAACGSDEGTTSQPTAADQRAANRKALLDYARCMRQNGVDMPDPQFEGNGRVMQRGPDKVDPAKARKADAACAKYRDAVKAPQVSEADKEKFRKAALANARCMREHGIDFPDPQFDENGGAQIQLGRGGVNPNDPKFKKAMEACRDTLPLRGRTDTEEDGG